MPVKDLEGMQHFYDWLDTHRQLITTTPRGYINTIRARYGADTGNDIKDNFTASRWLHKYRIRHGLTITCLTNHYVPHGNYERPN